MNQLYIKKKFSSIFFPSDESTDSTDSLRTKSFSRTFSRDRLRRAVENGWVRLERSNPGLQMDVLHKIPVSFQTVTEQRSWKKKVKDSFINYEHYLFIVILAVLSVGASSLQDEAIYYLIKARQSFVNIFSESAPRFGMLLLFHFFFGYLAVSCVLRISKQAAGSGIPLVKALFSGVNDPSYLGIHTFIAKYFGLVFAFAAGLSIGREGPFVHTSSVLANQLCRFRFFSQIEKVPLIKKRVIIAGCAAGVVAVFGTPLGGAIFSLEVISSYFLMKDLLLSITCAIVGTLVFRQIWDRPLLISERSVTFNRYELVFALGIGAVIGLVAILYISTIRLLVRLLRKYIRRIPVFCVFLSIVVSSLAMFYFVFLQWNHLDLAKDIMEVELKDAFYTEGVQSVYWNLFLIFAIKFVLTTTSVILPIPCGMFTPLLIMGAAIGRLFGELIARQLKIHVSAYALLGAAAMIGGVTQTFSSAVIMFEATGQITHALPVLVAVVVSIVVCHGKHPSIYDTLIRVNRVPFLPSIRKDKEFRAYSAIASDVMSVGQNVTVITTKSTYAEVACVLMQSESIVFPIVHSPDDFHLVGIVSRTVLERVLEEREDAFQQLCQVIGSTVGSGQAQTAILGVRRISDRILSVGSSLSSLATAESRHSSHSHTHTHTHKPYPLSRGRSRSGSFSQLYPPQASSSQNLLRLSSSSSLSNLQSHAGEHSRSFSKFHQHSYDDLSSMHRAQPISRSSSHEADLARHEPMSGSTAAHQQSAGEGLRKRQKSKWGKYHLESSDEDEELDHDPPPSGQPEKDDGSVRPSRTASASSFLSTPSDIDSDAEDHHHHHHHHHHSYHTHHHTHYHGHAKPLSSTRPHSHEHLSAPSHHHHPHHNLPSTRPGLTPSDSRQSIASDTSGSSGGVGLSMDHLDDFGGSRTHLFGSLSHTTPYLAANYVTTAEFFNYRISFAPVGTRVGRGIVLINTSPLTINKRTPLTQVHILFNMLGMNCLCVVERGVLIGVIFREAVAKILT